MRFKLDEDVHRSVASLFAAAGHDVHTAYDEGLRGTTDSAIVHHCCIEDRALVTLDLDFADIRSYPPANYPGMIVLRVRNQSRQHLLQVMNAALALLESEQLSKRLWIVTEAGVRIRQ